MLGRTVALVAFALLAASARAQSYLMPANGPTKVWYGQVTTTSSGAWAVTFPAGLFDNTPQVQATAVSSDGTLPNAASATLTSESPSGASDLVILPNSIVLGGVAVKAAGAGVAVNVLAIGN